MPESTRSSRALADPHLWITILAGGVGSRFWPLSTPARPKQLLPLAGDRPLVVEALDRARALTPDERIRILAPAALSAPLLEALPTLPEACLWREPAARGTAPALAWAAWNLRRLDPAAVMISLHADHLLRPVAAMAKLLRGAVRLARSEGLLLTVGAPPDRPEPGFGYVRPGGRLAAPGLDAFRVGSFHEKPTAEVAEGYIAQGYLWNTGIFVWSVENFLAELGRHAPEIADRLHLLEEDDVEGFFGSVPDVSVDVAVLERSSKVGVVLADFQWDDVGGWEALARTRGSDDLGNVAVGHVHLVESSGNVVFAEDGPVVLYGVDGLVVVRTARATLVAARSKVGDLKKLLEDLPESLRRLEG